MILPSIGWKFIRMHGREKYIYMHIYDFKVLSFDLRKSNDNLPFSMFSGFEVQKMIAAFSELSSKFQK